MSYLKLILVVFSLLASNQVWSEEFVDETYVREIQPLFEARCVACHSCFNAPCQVNLQSYEGFERGANKELVYNGSRLQSIHPSRMWVDAHSTEQWRAKGFYDLKNPSKPAENILSLLLQQRAQHPKEKIKKQVAESLYCPDSAEELKKLGETQAQLGMPYGFPPLKAQEIQSINKWLEKGARGPQKTELLRNSKKHAEIARQIKEWEEFLNSPGKEHRLVARYIYEHLFLGHLYFKQDDKNFFRIVRSKHSCEKPIEEIGTRRPNDDPQTKKFHYCLRQLEEAMVAKTHIPYELSSAKLERTKKIFWESKWNVKKMPGYEPGVAENPFVAFQDIPAKARYQFLLDDSHFFVNTFIRGPVCNGSMAVNSIQEQFYVFFLDPSADGTVQSSEYEAKSRNLLILPGVWGSDVTIKETPSFVSKIVEHRETYRKFRSQWKEKTRPKGYSLNDIWDGDKGNPNAVLTVFRHNDNAAVLKGAVGDMPKTVFVLDYPLFERLVYNLVVNFDVYGNIGHQLLTRQYMDFIRMEAEELFLSFLPSEDRIAYRKEWYKGFLTQAKMKYIFPSVGTSEPTSVLFASKKNTKGQLIEKILFERLNAESRGRLDVVNWKSLNLPEKTRALDPIEQQLRRIAAVKAGKKTPFAQHFPDLVLLKVKPKKGDSRVFSLIHNREHENISWILAESLRFAPEEDSLVVHEGFWGAYPNMIFEVAEAELKTFIKHVLAVQSSGDYKKLRHKYGMTRYNPNFWDSYDALTARFKSTAPVDFGYLDLTRYDLE